MDYKSGIQTAFSDSNSFKEFLLRIADWVLERSNHSFVLMAHLVDVMFLVVALFFFENVVPIRLSCMKTDT